ARIEPDFRHQRQRILRRIEAEEGCASRTRHFRELREKERTRRGEVWCLRKRGKETSDFAVSAARHATPVLCAYAFRCSSWRRSSAFSAFMRSNSVSP